MYTHVSAAQFSQLLTRASHRHLQLDTAEFAENYNKLPFLFKHDLADEPCYSLNQLCKLCHQLPRKLVKVRRGAVPVDTNFDASLEEFAADDVSIDQAFDKLAEEQLYIAIYFPETVAAYRDLVEQPLGEIARATQGKDGRINWYATYIFVSAQQSLTPYHMDREMNFLLQVRGTKHAELWDPLDDRVMSEDQRAKLFGSRDSDARPEYHSALEPLAMSFELKPGRGIHHPFIAPHLITTTSEISVSHALTYRTTLSDVWTDAYRLNYRLGKLGSATGKVRKSRVLDRCKAVTLRGIRAAKRKLRPPAI